MSRWWAAVATVHVARKIRFLQVATTLQPIKLSATKNKGTRWTKKINRFASFSRWTAKCVISCSGPSTKRRCTTSGRIIRLAIWRAAAKSFSDAAWPSSTFNIIWIRRCWGKTMILFDCMVFYNCFWFAQLQVRAMLQIFFNAICSAQPHVEPRSGLSAHGSGVQHLYAELLVQDAVVAAHAANAFLFRRKNVWMWYMREIVSAEVLM